MDKKCRLCGSEKIEKIKDGVRDNKSISVFRCKNCGLEFLSEQSHIDNNFYNEGKMHSKYSIENWVKNTYNDDKRRFELLKKYIKNKSILDFGAGNGGFIKLAKNISNATGYDLDSSLKEHYEKNGLPIINSLDEIDQKFDYITMFHVLEHIKEPEIELERLKSLLNPNGKLVIEVPNSKDALLTIFKNEAFKNFTYWSCHLYTYNEKTLKLLLKHSNFKINKIYHVQRYPYTNHLGWIKEAKAGGHKRHKANEILNKLYTKFLQITKKTDTILVIASVKT